MSGFSFGLVSGCWKKSSSFAYAQLRFLGFSFGLSFIQESYFTVNTDYLNPLFLAEVYGVAFFGLLLLLLFWPTRLLILLLVKVYFLYSCSCSTPVFTQKCLFRKGNGQIFQKAILPQRCNCSVVCNISKYLGKSEKRSIANAHALLKVRHFRDTQVVFSYKHTVEY